jgi:hypothetical protein
LLLLILVHHYMWVAIDIGALARSGSSLE